MQMSLCLSRGARKSERVTVLMYEGLHAFLCIRYVAMDHCACVCVCVCVFKYKKKKKCFSLPLLKRKSQC